MFGDMFGGAFHSRLGYPIEFKGKQYMQLSSLGYIGEKENQEEVLLVIETIEGRANLPAIPVVIKVPASWLRKE
jgi:hypothetical protein